MRMEGRKVWRQRHVPDMLPPVGQTDSVVCREGAGHERIRRASGRIGALRTDVRAGARTPRCVTGPPHERSGVSRAARRVLHKPAESSGSGDGPADHREGIDARERADSGGDGRDPEGTAGSGEFVLTRVMRCPSVWIWEEQI